MLLLCLCGAALLSSSIAFIQVDPANRQLVDEEGRQRFFHGLNVVVKSPPWIPTGSSYLFGEEEMKKFQQLGLNALRLGMMWPGVEPTRNQVNRTYLEVARNLTNLAASYGIYTLLDMHQDGYNARLCGEGLPDWSVNTGNAPAVPFPFEKTPFPIDPSTGFPYSKDCQKFSWPTYYWTEAVSAAFQMLYNNTDGLQDSFAAFWSTVAQHFKEDENILGYELINEPWAGDVYANPGLVLPTIADKENFQPMYDRVNRAIREVDDQHCIYFEGITWDELTNGFDHVPGGDQYRNRSVVSYHFYIPPDVSLKASMEGHVEDLNRLQCAGFLTEFDIYDVNDLLFETLDLTDSLLQSWMGWDYRSYYNIEAVAGLTKQMHFNNMTMEFTLVYQIQEGVSSRETEIYLNIPLHYRRGYAVTITPTSAAEWVATSTHITVTHSSTLKPGSTVQVDIRPV